MHVSQKGHVLIGVSIPANCGPEIETNDIQDIRLNKQPADAACIPSPENSNWIHIQAETTAADTSIRLEVHQVQYNTRARREWRRIQYYLGLLMSRRFW